METFTIYPKKGEPFELRFRRFEFNELTGEVVLYDDHQTILGVLMRPHLAAIAPSELHQTQRRDMLTFTVLLREHLARPLTLNANAYVRDPGFDFIVDNRPLSWVYVDPAEILAITYRPTN